MQADAITSLGAGSSERNEALLDRWVPDDLAGLTGFIATLAGGSPVTPTQTCTSLAMCRRCVAYRSGRL